MALQEPSVDVGSGGSSQSWSNDEVCIITVISASASRNRATRYRVMEPIRRNLLLLEDFCEVFIKSSLESIVDIPRSFMAEKLSRMLRNSILQQRRGVNIGHFCVYVYVSQDYCCWYNIVNAPCFSYGDEQCPSIESMRSLACESGGVYSLPAGAMGIKRLKVQDCDHKEDDCAICLQGFSASHRSEVIAELPCSHVFHPSRVLEWFVQKVTCPLCRSPCNQVF